MSLKYCIKQLYSVWSEGRLLSPLEATLHADDSVKELVG